MDIFKIFISESFLWYFLPLYLISILNGAVYFTYLWQLKEYRFDRMWDSIKLKSGLKKFFPTFYTNKVKILLIGLLIFQFSGQASPWFLAITGYIALGFEIFDLFYRATKRKIYRPDKTIKALLTIGLILGIFVGAGFIEFSLFFSSSELFSSIGKLSLGELETGKFILYLTGLTLLIQPISGLVILILTPFTLYLKKRLIVKAKQKIASHKNLKVIGITGSFGKSSTKEFLFQILSQHFKVLKTPGNINVDIGVAQIILRNLKPEHEIMIAEMGAYKIGEIKKIGDMIKPSIGIVTAAQGAHLSLFKSWENLKKAKFELIESLQPGGIGIFNLDNPGSFELAQWTKQKIAKCEKDIKVITFSANNSNITINNDSTYQAKNIKIEAEKLSFWVKEVLFEVELAGKQTIPNLLAAIIAAQECGLSLKKISAAVKDIKPPERTMEIKKSPNYSNILVIDDSYNANPQGVLAALDYLEILKDSFKIMVFPGMLELGENSYKEHIRVGKKIREVCDYVIFTSEDFIKPLKEGLGDDFEGKYIFCTQTQGQQKILQKILELEEQLKKNDKKNLAILFESRGAEQVMVKLLK